jgi:hypothetical protein
MLSINPNVGWKLPASQDDPSALPVNHAANNADHPARADAEYQEHAVRL